MSTSQPGKHWAVVISVLVIIIAIGSIVAWSRYSHGQPLEISAPPPPQLQTKIYIDGAVNNPGAYPLKAGDSLENIVRAAGGLVSNADLNQLKLYIPRIAETQQPQKVDINRAEDWLLEALPGIGKTRAKAIIDYRSKNGLFANINELTKVEGIGLTTFEQIKNQITVAD